MTISIERLPYRGRKAAVYDERRETTRKWRAEHAAVEFMLRRLRESSGRKTLRVLDIPVGTGRFLDLYHELNFRVLGLDASEVMLEAARGRRRGDQVLAHGDARSIKFMNRSHDIVVCARLLHLLSEENMRIVTSEICRVASRVVILTIQLGPKFRDGAVVATHDERKFVALVRGLGFRITERRLADEARGWWVIGLERV